MSAIACSVPAPLRVRVIAWTEVQAGAWRFSAAAVPAGICGIALPGRRQTLENWIGSRFVAEGRNSNGARDAAGRQLEAARRWLVAYAAGCQLPRPPLVLVGTEFQRSVWSSLLAIPPGKTWTYRQVAERVQKPNAYRAVGQAVGRNPIAVIIPCHRVVGSNGKLVGFGGGLPLKKELLNHEKAKAGSTPAPGTV